MTQPLTLAELARQIVSAQRRELAKRAGAAAKGRDSEAVHAMRVATRRLRSTLDVLGADLDVRDDLAKRLAWIARVLGRVRDRDVLIELLEHSASGLGLRGGEAARLRALLARLRGGRHEQLLKLRAAFARRRWARLLKSLKRFAREPKLLPGTGEPAARVRAQADQLAAAITAHGGMTAAKPTSGQLHELRIDFKRLRYVLEVHAALDLLAFGTELKLAREMQDVLGLLHDHDLLIARLDRGKGAFGGPWNRLRPALAGSRGRLLRRFRRLRAEWIAQTRPKPAPPVEALRFVNLEPQPVTLRLVAGA